MARPWTRTALWLLAVLLRWAPAASQCVWYTPLTPDGKPRMRASEYDGSALDDGKGSFAPGIFETGNATLMCGPSGSLANGGALPVPAGATSPFSLGFPATVASATLSSDNIYLSINGGSSWICCSSIITGFNLPLYKNYSGLTVDVCIKDGPSGCTGFQKCSFPNGWLEPACQRGYSYQGGTYATACPAGSAKHGVACDTPCSECPPGTNASVPGSKACVPCPRGYYAELPATRLCTPCLPGTASNVTGATSRGTCIPCERGTAAGRGSPRCTPCPPGWYADGVASEVCKACPRGTYRANSTSATSLESCVPCRPGSYNALTGRGNCTLCPAGSFSTATGALNSSVCTPCPAGSYGLTAGAGSMFECTPCPAGSFGTVPGQASVGAGCPSVCGPGTYSPPGATGCQQCPRGTYSKYGGEGQCTQCPAGTYGFYEGQSDVSMCTQCPAGTWSSETGKRMSSDCNPCPAGSYSTALGAVSLLSCRLCPVETYSSILGADSPTLCLPCGKLSASVPGATTCSPDIPTTPTAQPTTPTAQPSPVVTVTRSMSATATATASASPSPSCNGRGPADRDRCRCRHPGLPDDGSGYLTADGDTCEAGTAACTHPRPTCHPDVLDDAPAPSAKPEGGPSQAATGSGTWAAAILGAAFVGGFAVVLVRRQIHRRRKDITAHSSLGRGTDVSDVPVASPLHSHAAGMQTRSVRAARLAQLQDGTGAGAGADSDSPVRILV